MTLNEKIELLKKLRDESNELHKIFKERGKKAEADRFIAESVAYTIAIQILKSDASAKKIAKSFEEE